MDLLLFQGKAVREKYKYRFPFIGEDSYHRQHPFNAVFTDLLVYSGIEALIGEGGAGAAEALGGEGIGGTGARTLILK